MPFDPRGLDLVRRRRRKVSAPQIRVFLALKIGNDPLCEPGAYRFNDILAIGKKLDAAGLLKRVKPHYSGG